MQVRTADEAAASASVSFNIHKGKTMILKYNKESTNSITLDGKALEEVEPFTYLRSIIDERGGPDTDIKTKIG
ncbi:unnamed protein product [Schistosoma margrebowiei]|uniref:Uncharacterized protein n=1 Tax=Schistosoma margrebowiei TaxID=48269 RepID=A0A183MVP1_9TREM|nr:unnamed protein product [Schistosoma margrebowiei]